MPTEKPADQREAKEASPNGTAGERGGSVRTRLVSRVSKRRPDEVEKKLQDYTAWVNNYLKRKPGVPLVTDLRTDLQDGVTFVNLVEIVAKAVVEGIDHAPTTPVVRRTNIERVAAFLINDGALLHHDAVRDILDGNAKGVMRVILAIAERYQPRSVKPRSSSDPKSAAQQHVHHVTKEGSPDRSHMTKPGSPDNHMTNSGHDVSRLAANSVSVPNMAALPRERSLSQPSSQLLPGYGPPRHNSYAGLSQPDRPYYERAERPYERINELAVKGLTNSLSQTDYGGNDTYCTPFDQLPPSAAPQIIAKDMKMHRKKMDMSMRLRSGSLTFKSIPEEPSETAMDEVFKEMGSVLSGLAEFKTELLQLHAALLRNSDGSLTATHREGTDGGVEEKPTDGGGVEEKPTDGGGVEEKPTVGGGGASSGEGDPTTETKVVSDLQDELSQLQDEYTQMESECATLRNMVEERNTFITTMKTEIYRKEYRNDTERVDLHNQILQKDAVIKKLEGELTAIRSSLEEQQNDMELMRDQMEERAGQEAEFEELRAEVARLISAEEALQARLSGRDRKIVHLEEKLTDMADTRQRRMEALSEDMDGIREGLSSLRSAVPAQDPQQSTIDTLEKSISEVMAKLMERAGSPSGKRSRRHRETEDHHRDRDKRSRRHKHSHDSRESPYQSVRSHGDSKESPYQSVRSHGDSKESPYQSIRSHGDSKESPYQSIRSHGDSKESPYQSMRSHGDSKESPYQSMRSHIDPKGESPYHLARAEALYSTAPGEVTKVFYYMLSDKTETPYVTLVPKKAGVTLRDFKSVFDRHGNFRFFFKTEDPDCGVVKEEIIRDDHVLPTWNGKVLVWVSERERSHHR